MAFGRRSSTVTKSRRCLPPSTTSTYWSLDDDLQQLQKTMLSMLTDSSLSDVYLVVEGVDVPAHKAVLAAWSRPFRAMFTLPMLESRHKCRVAIKDAEHKHLMVVLEYLYSGRVGLNDQNVMPVSALANRYEVVPLMAQCEGYMKWRLNPSNVCRHLLAAEDHQCASMAACALEYLAVHFDEVHHDSSSDFDALAGETVLRVLQHEGLTVDEETVFLAVDGWAKAWRRRSAIRDAASTASVGGSSSPPSRGVAHPTVPFGRTVQASCGLIRRAEKLSIGEFGQSMREGLDRPKQQQQQQGGGGGGSSNPCAVADSNRQLRARDRAVVGFSGREDLQRMAGGGIRRDRVAMDSSTTTTTTTTSGGGATSGDSESTARLPSFPAQIRSKREQQQQLETRKSSKTPPSPPQRQSRSLTASPAASLTLPPAARSIGDYDNSSSSTTNNNKQEPINSRLLRRRHSASTSGTARSSSPTINAGDYEITLAEALAGATSPRWNFALSRHSTMPSAMLGATTVSTFGGFGGGGGGAAAPAPATSGAGARAGGARGRTRERGHTVEGYLALAVRFGDAIGTEQRLAAAAAAAAASGCLDGGGGGERAEVGGGGAAAARVASFSLPPPSSPGLRNSQAAAAWTTGASVSSDGVRKASLGGGGSAAAAAVVDTGKEKDSLEDLPEEERAMIDQLFMEVRFPLISTSFLCQVVEKSHTVSGSRLAQRLLHEAYRFQAIRPDAADVDEHFPGNHRVKYRGHEVVLFGEGDGCVGTVDDYSSSMSEVHLVENVQSRDEKYWLPGQPEEAYVCIRLDRVRRITKFRFQNRYSEEFEVAVRRTLREEWQAIVPRQPSGGHKDVKELDLTRKRVKARHVKISLRGRKRSCYNTSVYWTELLGF